MSALKKYLSIFLVFSLVFTMVFVAGTSVSATTTEKNSASASLDIEASSENPYNLASSSEKGNIIQCFDWRFKDIERYAEEIAKAGFTTVQTSPVQKTVITSNCGSYGTDWWSFYQPTSLSVGNALGTSDEFKSMADTLHKYGIK
ncbi:MAG: hypothetical protein ACI4QE_04120, partial [Acutalibacteraceae bacterium]